MICKMCGTCKRIKENLGGLKTYICDNKTCEMEKADRDVHSARTILMRGMYETKLK
jgi:hypothetical protein